jgi:hypothetical protein
MADPKNYDDADDPYRAIRVGDPGVTGEATKWGHLLTRFMRLMAIFWLLQGLMQWLAVLTAQKPIFDTMPQNAALAIIFFSVLDLIAGVGLWLATPWGGVLWLLIASAQIFVAASMPRFFVGGYWLIGVNLVLIVLYFALTFEAGRDFEAQSVIERRRKRKAAITTATVEPTTAPDVSGRIARGVEAKPRVSTNEIPEKGPLARSPVKPREPAPLAKGESRWMATAIEGKPVARTSAAPEEKPVKPGKA